MAVAEGGVRDEVREYGRIANTGYWQSDMANNLG